VLLPTMGETDARAKVLEVWKLIWSSTFKAPKNPQHSLFTNDK
jgi:hypothetical protein